MAVLNILKKVAGKYNDSSLIIRILIGIVIGVILTVIAPGWTWIGTLGSLFVGALKRCPNPGLCFGRVRWPGSQ